MHLEASRYALYREAQTFLEGRDSPATTAAEPRTQGASDVRSNFHSSAEIQSFR